MEPIKIIALALSAFSLGFSLATYIVESSLKKRK